MARARLLFLSNKVGRGGEKEQMVEGHYVVRNELTLRLSITRHFPQSEYSSSVVNLSFPELFIGIRGGGKEGWSVS